MASNLRSKLGSSPWCSNEPNGGLRRSSTIGRNYSFPFNKVHCDLTIVYGLRMLATNLSISVAKVLFSILAELSNASPMSMSYNGIGSNTNLQSL